MTTDELTAIEDRWRFGTNTRDDVRKLLQEIERYQNIMAKAAFSTVDTLITQWEEDE